MTVKSNLLKRGFLSLLGSQFFGAMNDNILKGILTFMVIDGAWAGELGKGGQGIVGIFFTVPFILLSGYAGQIADRFSKRKVLIGVKIVEIPVALLGLAGFWMGNLWLTLGSLILLTCQSSFFGPAKYGVIPELVGDGELSRANGTINMMTNVAVIVGTLAAGFISDAYSPLDGTAPMLWLPGVCMLVVAAMGLAAAISMTRLEAGDKDLEWDWNPFSTYIESVKEMAKSKLLMVMFAWGYFYLLAGLALFIVPEYTVVLGVNRTLASVLLGVMGIAIGVGCGVAGFISGKRIETRLIPIGALGLIVFFALLALVPPTKMPKVPSLSDVALSNVSLFIFGAGFSAGFYIVPLQALLQKMSPDDERGRFLGTANACSFTFLTIAAGLYAVIRNSFGDSPQRIFLICSLLMAIGAGYFLWRLRGTGLLIGQGIPADSTLNTPEPGEAKKQS